MLGVHWSATIDGVHDWVEIDRLGEIGSECDIIRTILDLTGRLGGPVDVVIDGEWLSGRVVAVTKGHAEQNVLSSHIKLRQPKLDPNVDGLA